MFLEMFAEELINFHYRPQLGHILPPTPQVTPGRISHGHQVLEMEGEDLKLQVQIGSEVVTLGDSS